MVPPPGRADENDKVNQIMLHQFGLLKDKHKQIMYYVHVQSTVTVSVISNFLPMFHHAINHSLEKLERIDLFRV